MARRKKPEGETTEQTKTRRLLESIADNATRGEKVAWDRKMNNMVTLLAKLKPIEEKILDLMAEKTPIMDEIAALRHDMVRECTHPYTHLTQMGDVVLCKFCNRKFNVKTNGSSEA
jgi:hypothetical protein